MSEAEIGIIGGSGLYAFDGLEILEEREITTPFGKASAPIVIGRLGNTRVAFLARHGRGHIYNPSEVPYRANIFALKLLGVSQVIAVSACGSLREDYAPGHIVVPSGLFDFTKKRSSSFLEDGIVGHISVAEPYCNTLRTVLIDAVRQAGGTVHSNGIFITIEGPRFSTPAESHLFRNWGMAIIGMTTSPEAFLAREAGMCYAVMAHVTDYDVWHQSEEPVTVEMVIRTMNQNLHIAQRAVVEVVKRLGESPMTCPHAGALKDAILTSRAQIKPEAIERLKPILGGLLD